VKWAFLAEFSSYPMTTTQSLNDVELSVRPSGQKDLMCFYFIFGFLVCTYQTEPISCVRKAETQKTVIQGRISALLVELSNIN
jgi:hypothetical protein